jgi:sortase (surface protein transpeptidase)
MSALLMAALLSTLIPSSLTGVTSALAAPSAAQPSSAAPFADGAFESIWTRNDLPVADETIGRSWTWGPAPLASGLETYLDAPDGSGKRLVQYFDKARMEINNPGADPLSNGFVTNGLLTVELISGRMQVGDSTFVNNVPAAIDLASDPDDANAPTYSSFGTVANTSAGEHRQPDNSDGGYASQRINRQGDVRDDSAMQLPESKIAYFEPATGHNVPQVFWDFLNSKSTVQVGIGTANKLLLDPWVVAMGLPISDAYWANVKIGGQNQDVLIQAFERRVLTYVPGLPQEWQVQMGNIGQHYFEWRYGTAGVSPQKPTKPAPSNPAYIVIPRLGVQTKVEAVGVDNNSNMDIPADPYNAAWYKYGPLPGTVGNAVIDGHLDWYGIKEAIFYYLDRLQPGDRIYIRDDQGVDRAFAVSKNLLCPYNKCPLEEIFGATSATRLNLITCAGVFNTSQQNYNKRLVVFADAVQ